MTTFLAGGTGTPKLLAGADDVFPPETTTVVGNTGDDVELGGLFVCPDVDTVLFLDGGVLDRDTWWGIDDDTDATHDELHAIAERAGLEPGPRYLPADRQTAGRDLARWRRFSGVAEFMFIGDRDRAVHLTRTSLLDEGHTLTEATRTLADAFGLERDLLPMSDDPVASIVDTADGPMHFQEFWVAREGEPTVEGVEFRGVREVDGPVVGRGRGGVARVGVAHTLFSGCEERSSCVTVGVVFDRRPTLQFAARLVLRLGRLSSALRLVLRSGSSPSPRSTQTHSVLPRSPARP